MKQQLLRRLAELQALKKLKGKVLNKIITNREHAWADQLQLMQEIATIGTKMELIQDIMEEQEVAFRQPLLENLDQAWEDDTISYKEFIHRAQIIHSYELNY